VLENLTGDESLEFTVSRLVFGVEQEQLGTRRPGNLLPPLRLPTPLYAERETPNC